MAGVNGTTKGVETTPLSKASAQIVIFVSKVLVTASLSLVGVRSQVYKPKCVNYLTSVNINRIYLPVHELKDVVTSNT